MKTAVVDFDSDPNAEDFVPDPNVCYVKALDKTYLGVVCFLRERGERSERQRIRF